MMVDKRVSVASSTDPTKVGRSGTVLLETAKTLLIGTRSGRVRVEKKGAAFILRDSGKVVVGDDITGRPEDYIGRVRI